jgi:hypothetical protein
MTEEKKRKEEELLNDRVNFKLYAAEQHLNQLKDIKQKYGHIMGSTKIRIQTEMEIDCFLAHVIGAKDSLLVQINDDLGLGIPIEKVNLETVNAKLNDINKTNLLKHLDNLTGKKTSWLWLLNEIRNHSLHRKRIPRLVHVNITENISNNTSYSSETIHFVGDARIKDNPFMQKDIILFLQESLDRMRKLVENVRKKLKN